MHNFGKDSFCLFENKNKIRIFLYNSLEQVHFFAKSLIHYMKFYSLILVQTVTKQKKKIISSLGLLKNHKAIYVLHRTNVYGSMNFPDVEVKNRIWTLGHFNIGLQVNPHYFGKIKLREKNKITRFFIVSTVKRNYKYIISAVKKIINENLEFKIFVVGYKKGFSIDNNNKKLKDIFIFNYNVNFSTLYNIIDSSDYIIINLDPDIDKAFKKEGLSGSAQLSYGFYKPALINGYFKDNYNMTEENSFIFDKKNFYNIMKEAILLNNKRYKNMQRNLIKLSNKIYNISLLNVKKTINSLLKSI